ncbi:MAG: hypothetical protein KF794_09325 [Xanthobacteraceae bacterium]|nr:hypothetical protein [Xanthobacteraceae bacterium]QYK43996.1 MAG: hypothetical protein KF794_09325 [Xanthobacteraceae bacterium]
MLRLAAILILAFTSFAGAQTPREKLEGFYKIPFGTPLEAVKAKLGPAAGESYWQSEDKTVRLKTITHHDPDLKIGGRSHFVTYYFSAEEKLIAAAFVAKYQSKEEDDVAACYRASAVMKDIIAQHGQPNSQREREGALYVLFSFKDGSEIEARIDSEDNDCELRLVLRSAEGEKRKLFDD